MYMKIINTTLLLYGLMLIVTVATCSFNGAIQPDKLQPAIILFVIGCAFVVWVGIYGLAHHNCSKTKAKPVDTLITLDNVLAEKIYKALASSSPLMSKWPVKDKEHKVEIIKNVITIHRTK